MSSTVRPPPAQWDPADPRALVALITRVARADHDAFARLYALLAPAVAGYVRTARPDPTEAGAITAGTFVEAWWLARYHTAQGTDVFAWILGIAIRRAGDRRCGLGNQRTSGSDGPGPDAGRQQGHPLSNVLDRHTELALTALLKRGTAAVLPDATVRAGVGQHGGTASPRPATDATARQMRRPS